MRRVLPLLALLCSPLAVAQWSAIQSPHFRVVTDAGDRRGREVALRLEQMRHGFGQILLKNNLHDMTPLRTLAFHDYGGLAQVTPEGVAAGSGFFLKNEDEDFLALDASSPDGWPQALREYGETLLASNYPITPLWFDVGVPEYFASIGVSKSDLEFGRTPARLSLDGHWIPAERLLAVSSSDPEFKVAAFRMQFTGESWLLINWLMRDRMSKAGEYFGLLQQGTGVSEAVGQAFGVSLAELDIQLRSARELPVLHYRLPQIEAVNFSYEALKPWEGATAVAEMQAHEKAKRPQAVNTLEQVSVLHPDYGPAQAALGFAYFWDGNEAAAGRHLRKAMDLGATTGAAYFWAAQYVMKSGVRDSGALQQMNDLLQHGLKIDPQFAAGWAARGTALEWAKNWAEAATALRNAARLDPRHGAYQLELALCIAHQRKWSEALALLKTLESHPDPQTAAAALRQYATVQEWEKHPILESAQQDAPVKDELAEWRAKHPERAAELQKMQSEQSGEGESTDQRPTRFVKGVLRSVVCTPPSAMLLVGVDRKLLHLRVADTGALTLIGAQKFDCAWNRVKVAVNFKESAKESSTKGDTGVVGDAISLEVQ